jgi:hypothetical protein
MVKSKPYQHFQDSFNIKGEQVQRLLKNVAEAAIHGASTTFHGISKKWLRVDFLLEIAQRRALFEDDGFYHIADGDHA